MRIHLVSEHASPLTLLGGADAGGQNVHVAMLATSLARMGNDVVVHTRRADPTLARRVALGPDVVVDHVDAGPPEPMPKDALLPLMGEFAADLERQWRRRRPDVVHAHFWMSGLAAVVAADRLRVPVALTYHALGEDKRRFQGEADTSPPARIITESWLARTADRVIATSAAERRTLTGWGARADRVDVVPCGVDLDLFRPAPRGPHQQVQHREPPRRVVCVSRLVPRKGIADVIEAVARLDDVELLIAGGPPAAMLADDPYARELLELVDTFGAGDRIRLLGAVERDRVPPLMRSAAAVCCTPWYEPFGMVAVEAMACGVPVIASNVGGLAETVVDGRTGIHVPPREPGAIAEAITRLLERPRMWRNLGTAGAMRALRYSWTRVARHTLDALLTADYRHPGPPPPAEATDRWERVASEARG